MTPEQEAAIRARHVIFVIHGPVDDEAECYRDGQPWPCDTAQALAALDAKEAVFKATLDGFHELEARYDAALAREKALAEALRAMDGVVLHSISQKGCDCGGHRALRAALAAHEEARR